MSQIKFYRVEALPETGEVGGIYFVYGEEPNKVYICTQDGFEIYTEDISSIINDDVTYTVLGTTSLKEAYLEPFDAEIASQLKNIIGE